MGITKVKKEHLAIGLALIGGGSLTLGAALVYAPAGFIVLGLLCLGSLWVDF